MPFIQCVSPYMILDHISPTMPTLTVSNHGLLPGCLILGSLVSKIVGERWKKFNVMFLLCYIDWAMAGHLKKRTSLLWLG